MAPTRVSGAVIPATRHCSSLRLPLIPSGNVGNGVLMRTAGLIVAAGRGQRLGGETPKQYLPLGESTVLRRAVAAVLAHPGVDMLQVVIHPDDRELCIAALDGLEDARLLPPVDGGASRSDSVLAGLEALAPAAPDRVLIHDAARPFLPAALVSTVIDALDAYPAVLPALPVVDALWRDDGRACRGACPARRPLAGADAAGLPLRRYPRRASRPQRRRPRRRGRRPRRRA